MFLSAFETLRKSIEDLDERVPDVKNNDIKFLKEIMDSQVMSSLVKVHDKIEGANGSGNRVIESGETSSLIQDVKKMCSLMSYRNRNAAELNKLLNNPHLNALAEAHDNVACKVYEEPELSEESYEMDVFANDDSSEHNTIRMIGIRKSNNEPLGMTVKVEDGFVVVARILAGGLIDRQGMLHVGDIILEVNGEEINTPEQLQEQLRNAKGSVTFKVSATNQDQIPNEKCYMKALFTYDPTQDGLLPCREVGLTFEQGEILEILNQEDPNWWQARKANTPYGYAGLIPSQELEERRQAFVIPEHDHATRTSICGTRITKHKKKEMYHLQTNAEFDKAELILYEEVCQKQNFDRKVLLLIGAQGVGKRSLKTRLINYEPNKFASPLPHTSRPIREGEIDGKAYHFVKREIMESEIANNEYLEFGEFQYHLYGTKLESVRQIIQSGKICILDCNPQCIKILRNAEFTPFIVFIGAPPIDQLRFMNEWGRNNLLLSSGRYQTFDRALNRQSSRRLRSLRSLQSFYEDEDMMVTVDESARILRLYNKHFDLIIVNNNFEKTFEQLKDAIDALSTQPQWVPITWVNSE